MPAPVREFMFHDARKWRIDFAWTDVKLAVEIEGGAWANGRHTRGKGFIADMEKYNALAEYGWRLLRYVPNSKDKRNINYAQIARLYIKLKRLLIER